MIYIVKNENNTAMDCDEDANNQENQQTFDKMLKPLETILCGL